MPSELALDPQILSLANDLGRLIESLHRLSDASHCEDVDRAECLSDCQEVLQRTRVLLAELSYDHR
jgi:hypothetical protein